MRAGSAAVALVDPAQLAHDLAAVGRLAGARGARRRAPSPSPASCDLALARPPARAPADARLVAGALGQPHPAAAADDEPLRAAAHAARR